MFGILSNRDSAINLKHLLQMRLRLERRRLEEAFLLSASLEIIVQYNLWDKLLSLPCDRNEMVKLVANPFCDAFLSKWGGKYCKALLFNYSC